MISDDIEDLVKHFREGKSPVQLTDDAVSSIRNKLLVWYSENRRKLPWRGDKVDRNGQPFDSVVDTLVFPNPYGTWIR